jgi:type II secretory pathway predicted ATPase ExeA
MIRSWFGLTKTVFAIDELTLLSHQQAITDIVTVHCRQGGLCLILGDPGVGKSCIKQSIQQTADKRMVVLSIGRTMHTYKNTIKILRQAFSIDVDGSDFRCEKRLIEQAFTLHREGKSLVTFIDDAHLLDMLTLRKLRLLFDEFPPNHNLVLVGQGSLLGPLSLMANQDIKSRITYSTIVGKLTKDDVESFVLAELTKAGLGHNVFSPEALGLIARSSDGLIRRAKNLCLSSLLEAVRDRKKEVGLEIVNRVLIQPHWRMEAELPAHLNGANF